jgi:DNA-binding transcriptional LysR family regulator
MDRLTAMETFVRVIEAGSFSGASHHLGVGQPAVSKTIAQLEERLGVKLLTRTTRGLTATEAGLAYYERAKRVIEESAEAEAAARGAGASLTGKLRISAAVTFASMHIIPKLPTFLEQHPKLELEVILDDRNIDLVQDNIDVSFRMGKLADSSLTIRRIGRSKRVIVGTPAYFERFGMPETPADLLNHNAVIYLQTGDDPWAFQRDGSEMRVSLKSQFKVTAAEGVRAAVLANIGYCVASEWMFSPEIESGKVCTVLTDWSLPPVDLFAVLPAGRNATAKVRALLQFIEESLLPLNIES